MLTFAALRVAILKHTSIYNKKLMCQFHLGINYSQMQLTTTNNKRDIVSVIKLSISLFARLFDNKSSFLDEYNSNATPVIEGKIST